MFTLIIFTQFPGLLLDLANMMFGVCWSYRDRGKVCPTEGGKKLTIKGLSKMAQGKLPDLSEIITICSEVSGKVVKRRVMERNKCLAVKNITCTTPIIG